MKQKIQRYQTKPILHDDPDVKLFLEVLYKRFAVVAKDKATINFAFICIKY